VIVRKSSDGELLSKIHIDNDPMTMAQAVAAAGPVPDVVLEATFDATDVVDLLRLGRLAEAWTAPPEVRELRELVRYRHKLMRLRAGLKAQVHAVVGKHGVLPSRGDMFGLGGNAQLDAPELPMAYSFRLESLRDLIAAYTCDIVSLDRRIHTQLHDDTGYNAIQAIHGVGPVLAAVFVAEAEPARTQPADGLVHRHHLPAGRSRINVIEPCWLRRIAPCSDPTTGPGEDITRQPSFGLA